jgi:hypothetical protein
VSGTLPYFEKSGFSSPLNATSDVTFSTADAKMLFVNVLYFLISLARMMRSIIEYACKMLIFNSLSIIRLIASPLFPGFDSSEAKATACITKNLHTQYLFLVFDFTACKSN